MHRIRPVPQVGGREADIRGLEALDGCGCWHARAKASRAPAYTPPFMRLRLLLLPLLCLPPGCQGDSHGAENGEGGVPVIAMIPKGTTHAFWKSVEKGARKAADEQGVKLIWKGPLKENDRAQQIQLVQQFLAQDVDGLLLAPLDHKALRAPVAQAGDLGIPVVIFDSSLEGEVGKDFLCLVATDNFEAGRLGGAKLRQLMGGTGKVVLLRYQVGSASTTRREEGFLEAVQEGGGVEILVDNRWAGPTVGEAKTESLNLMTRLREADGVFCCCEPVAAGMLLALRQEGLAGKIKFVGFDASPLLIAGLENGEIDALVVQDPQGMGALAVNSMVNHLEEKPVGHFMDTGAKVLTMQNLQDPEIRRLLE